MKFKKIKNKTKTFFSFLLQQSEISSAGPNIAYMCDFFILTLE